MSMTKSQTMNDRPYRNADWLHQKYHDEGLTTSEIANIAGCSGVTISNWLDKHGIETRDWWKKGLKAAHEARRVNYAKLYTSNTENSGSYEFWSVNVREDGENKTVRTSVHRLLAVAEYGVDAVAGKDVHHKNGLSWDNRPDNIEVLSKSEHSHRHNKQWYSDEELLEAIRAIDEQVDGRPKFEQMKEMGEVYPATCSERFGSWNNAVAASRGEHE